MTQRAVDLAIFVCDVALDAVENGAVSYITMEESSDKALLAKHFSELVSIVATERFLNNTQKEKYRLSALNDAIDLMRPPWKKESILKALNIALDYDTTC